MRKKIFSISDLKPAYQRVRRSLVVVIGGIMIAVSAVASQPTAIHDLQYCDVSPEKTMIVDETIIPKTFIEETSFRAEKNNIWIEETISELATYEYNWDGEGAKAVSQQTLDNVRYVLDKTNDFTKELQEIYPTPFGSVCFEWNIKGAFVNAEVSANLLAFYKDSNADSDINHDKEAFSNEAIDKLIDCLGNKI